VPDCARIAQQFFQMTKFPQIDRFRSTDKNRNRSLGIFCNKKFQTCERRQIIEFYKLCYLKSRETYIKKPKINSGIDKDVTMHLFGKRCTVTTHHMAR